MSIQLPSKCKLYEGIKPEDILIRPYNGADEILLAQINPINLERNFLTILKNVVKGIDPLRLTTGDRLYIILWEYAVSYSEILNVQQICSHCLQKVKFPVDIKAIPVDYLSDDYSEPKELKLPVSGETVLIRSFTVRDEVETEKMASQGKDTYLYKYARSIVCDEPFAQMERMKKWAAKDIAAIRKFHEIDAFHGPTSEVTMACPHCKEEEEVIVPFRFEFFYPTGEILRECFGA